MNRIGEVTQVRNNRIYVTFCRPEACAACGGCEGNKKQFSIWVSGQAEIGDFAVVEMPEGIVLGASVLAYVLPLVFFLAGLLIGNIAFNGSEAGMILSALGALLISVGVLAAGEKRRQKGERWNPVLIDVVKNKKESIVYDQNI